MKNTPEDNQGMTRIFPWLAVLLTLLAYLPVMNNSFVNWDDSSYIQYNPHIRHLDPASLRWMFTNFHAGYWIPLTWLSLALDFWLGRLEPWVYHLDNLLLHLLNTSAVFSLSFKFLELASKARGRDHEESPAVWRAASAFGAALLFGLHPIHVESVAWASERKDLLCGFFFLSSLWVYLDYAARPEGNPRKYLVCLGLFILSILSKPMAVSLPFVFILLDHWPLGRLRSNRSKVLLEKIPFLIAASLSSWVAVLSQFQSGAGWGLDQSPLSFRFMNACHSLTFYLAKMLYPVHLTAFYPILLQNTFSPEYIGSALLVVLVTSACFIYRKKSPYFAMAWLYYLITLAPALGIVQVGNQAAADRFTYLPSLAPFLLLSTVFVRLLSHRRVVLLSFAIGLAALMGYGTFQQVLAWKNTITLWEKVLEFYPRNNLIVYQNLGRAYEEAGRLDDAFAQYDNAIVPGFHFFYPHWGKGRILSAKGLLDESVGEFKTAMQMNPSFPPLHSDLGMVYEKKGMKSEALAEVREAIRLDPNYAEAFDHWGALSRNWGQFGKAVTAFRTAHSLDPDNPTYLRNLIATCQQAGRVKEALVLYRELSNHPRSLLSLNY